MKIIKTINGELLNYAHLVEVRPVEGEGLNEAGEKTTMYGITALDILGKERDIGIYETEKERDSAFEMLEFFLTASTHTLFDMEGGDE